MKVDQIVSRSYENRGMREDETWGVAMYPSGKARPKVGEQELPLHSIHFIWGAKIAWHDHRQRVKVETRSNNTQSSFTPEICCVFDGNKWIFHVNTSHFLNKSVRALVFLYFACKSKKQRPWRAQFLLHTKLYLEYQNEVTDLQHPVVERIPDGLNTLCRGWGLIILPPMAHVHTTSQGQCLRRLRKIKNLGLNCWTEMCVVPVAERRAVEIWIVPAAVGFQQTRDYSSKPGGKNKKSLRVMSHFKYGYAAWANINKKSNVKWEGCRNVLSSSHLLWLFPCSALQWEVNWGYSIFMSSCK